MSKEILFNDTESEKLKHIKTEIYTDGGCMHNGSQNNVGSWAYVVVENNKYIYGSSYRVYNITNNKMELTAIIKALEYAVDRNIKEVTIVSDSQYCINGCTIWKSKWIENKMNKKQNVPVLNSNLWLQIYALQNKVETKFRWVKGHSGYRWNEYVDKLCTQEIQQPIKF